MEKSSTEYKKYLEECLSYLEEAKSKNEVTDREYVEESARLSRELLEFDREDMV